ncbi:ABC transporter ATP-binding protein [Clostridium estertheticum]|uniref:ABC transporter ATP-binding protein n=1 Tax=Clostridium estertheticum TaxID=238834 RepID=UPI001CF2FDB1|nr:ABC transporter ATP-binding protein [Clostridium estertheticum]MCB2341496.1 ABC transporter ATP-binding protein/permease [Clostridium estertheticum]
MDKDNEKKMWVHILKFSKIYAFWIALSIFATLVLTYSNIFTSQLLKKIIDMAVSKNIHGIDTYILMGLIVFILGITSKYFFRYATGKYGNCVMRDIRSATVDYVNKLPPDYTMKNKIGEILAKLSGDANVVQNFMANEFINLIYMPIMLIGFGAYLTYLNWRLFLASSIILPILVPLSVKLISPIKKYQREYVKYLGKTNNIVQNSIDGISIIKAYNLEEEMANTYDESIKIATKIAFKNDKKEYITNPIITITGSLPGIISIIYGGYLCLQGNMSAGELIAFLNIFAMFTEPMKYLFHMIINIKVAMASVERLFSILDEPQEKSGNIRFTKESYDKNDIAVEFVNVDFSYDEKSMILNKLNLIVTKGKSIAIVGASGSGKSTILKLIGKINERQGGTIKICGQNIEDIEIESLREYISYVSQRTFLFPFSIKDNILIGNPKATMEDILKATKKANAHAFIEKLTDGYDTLVGEHGTKLSGGQIQRIALARAILKDSPILLLDEATSALDTQSEALIKDALDKFKKDKTLIIVAHRLSTIENADEIFVLEKGAIIENGTHNELIAKNSAYAKLHIGAHGEGATA